MFRLLESYSFRPAWLLRTSLYKALHLRFMPAQISQRDPMPAAAACAACETSTVVTGSKQLGMSFSRLKLQQSKKAVCLKAIRHQLRPSWKVDICQE